MQPNHLKKSAGTCECASSHTKDLSERSVKISSRSELDKDIELLSTPEIDGIIEEAAKAFGKRHVRTQRMRSRRINFGW